MWSWQLAGLVSSCSHSSLFSFPVFPASPSVCGIRSHPWCPPASSASGQGEQGGGQHFVKLPFMFLATFHPTPCGRAGPTLPGSLPGCGRSPSEPWAPPEQAYPVLFELLVSQRRWHLHGTILLLRDLRGRAENGTHSCRMGSGLPGALPRTQWPQLKAEGGRTVN